MIDLTALRTQIANRRTSGQPSAIELQRQRELGRHRQALAWARRPNVPGGDGTARARLQRFVWAFEGVAGFAAHRQRVVALLAGEADLADLAALTSRARAECHHGPDPQHARDVLEVLGVPMPPRPVVFDRPVIPRDEADYGDDEGGEE